MSNEADSEPGAEEGDSIEYDVSPWAGETRRILRTVLAERAIPHAWEGTVLVVPGAFEDAVDQIVEDVSSTARASLGTAREKVGFDVSAWSAASQNTLVDHLVEAKIPHEWDAEGDLLVHTEDADAVDGILDEIGDPDGGDEMDGLELHDRLGRLFVVADRLANDPEDSSGVRGIEEAYGAIEGAGLPFGIDAGLWLGIHRVAGQLRETVDDVAKGVEGATSFEVDGPGGPADDGDDDEPGDGGLADETDDRGSGEQDSQRPSVETLANELREMLRRIV